MIDVKSIAPQLTCGIAQNIMKVIMKTAKNLVNTLLSPINDLVVGIFPNVGNLLTTFNNFINNYIGPGLSWFLNLLPPMTKNILSIWLTFLIAYYGIVWTYHGIVQIYKLIQKVKFW